MNAFSLACLDMAGTTVADDGLVERAFTTAVAELGVEPGTDRYTHMIDVVRTTMGRSKIDVFRWLFEAEEVAQRGNAAFERAYGDLVAAGAVVALPGAEATFAALRTAGVRVALTTGFARPTQDAIIAALGWRDRVDLALCPSATVRGRPYPDLVLAAVAAFGVTDLGSVVVVGDTPSDIESGLAAEAGLVLGVLTGLGDRAALIGAGAHRVLDRIDELPAVLAL